MPQPPDFDQIALKLITRSKAVTQVALVEVLRLLWNTRGAADRALLDGELSSQMGSTAAGPYVKNLDRALRSLDR